MASRFSDRVFFFFFFFLLLFLRAVNELQEEALARVFPADSKGYVAMTTSMGALSLEIHADAVRTFLAVFECIVCVRSRFVCLSVCVCVGLPQRWRDLDGGMRRQ